MTEEDSDESYEVRPQWAKAGEWCCEEENIVCSLENNLSIFSSPVPTEPLPFPTDQPDTLTDLQHEALYLAKTDLEDLHVIGQGEIQP